MRLPAWLRRPAPKPSNDPETGASDPYTDELSEEQSERIWQAIVGDLDRYCGCDGCWLHRLADRRPRDAA